MEIFLDRVMPGRAFADHLDKPWPELIPNLKDLPHVL